MPERCETSQAFLFIFFFCFRYVFVPFQFSQNQSYIIFFKKICKKIRKKLAYFVKYCVHLQCQFKTISTHIMSNQHNL